MLYLQKKITSPLKTGLFQKENFILQPLIFRSYVFVFTGITSRVSLRYMTPTQTMALFCLREIPSQKLPARFFASSLIFSKKKNGFHFMTIMTTGSLQAQTVVFRVRVPQIFHPLPGHHAVTLSPSSGPRPNTRMKPQFQNNGIAGLSFPEATKKCLCCL